MRLVNICSDNDLKAPSVDGGGGGGGGFTYCLDSRYLTLVTEVISTPKTIYVDRVDYEWGFEVYRNRESPSGEEFGNRNTLSFI